jgi:hypothetical protein
VSLVLIVIHGDEKACEGQQEGLCGDPISGNTKEWLGQAKEISAVLNISLNLLVVLMSHGSCKWTTSTGSEDEKTRK